MHIRIADIDRHTLADLFVWCRACTCWECPEKFTRGKHTEEETRIKAEWFERMAGLCHPCGTLLYVDDDPAAYCQYAPPEHLPGVLDYGSLASRVDPNGVFISCLHVPPDHQRRGLGRRLLQEVIDEIKTRGVEAIETLGRDDSVDGCSGPTQLYLAQGFDVVATQDYSNGSSFSLVRLELSPTRG